MHVADALISIPVSTVAAGGAAALIALASNKVKASQRKDLVPLMGVMGAFVFAAQMINFTIPGTGSSGHLIGGILLSAILGPWAAFITLSSIIIVQCLIFADGGLMALGCNILNMAATSCLIAFPFIYKPICKDSLKPSKIAVASIIASLIAVESGAFAVTAETELSGITALPFSTFVAFMLPIHFVIGIAEGLVTASLLIFISKYSPTILNISHSSFEKEQKAKTFQNWKPISAILILTLIMAGGFSIFASEYPDGLEWSIEKVSGLTELPSDSDSFALMPDYNSNFAGILGALFVMVTLWALSSLIFSRLRKTGKKE